MFQHRIADELAGQIIALQRHLPSRSCFEFHICADFSFR
jgi:hypothetical protein